MLFPLCEQDRLDKKKNWVAEAGSQLENELLTKWAKQPGLTDEDRALIRDWIDGGYKRIAGSEQQKQFLKRWLEKRPLADWECNLIRGWINKPDSEKKRDELFQQAAKRSVVGHVIYETAKERQALLSPRAWVVAWAIAQGLTRKEIKTLIGRKEIRTVAYAIEEIKGYIDPDPKTRSLSFVQITEWFFGL